MGTIKADATTPPTCNQRSLDIGAYLTHPRPPIDCEGDISDILTIAGPAAVFLVCLTSGILVPIPEDGVTLFIGYLISQGELDPWVTVPLAVLGIFGRDSIAFGLGRGARSIASGRGKGEKKEPHRLVAKAQILAKRLGRGSLYAARLAVGLRLGLYVAAGLAGHTWKRFLIYEMIAVPIVVPFYLWLGATFGPDAFEVIKGWF